MRVELRVVRDAAERLGRARTHDLEVEDSRVGRHRRGEVVLRGQSGGIEVALQTNWAKSSLRGGVQPSLSLNFDQTLPQDIAFEYNVGFNAQDNDAGKRQYQLALSWAFQREVVDDVAVFVNGFTNTGQGASSSAVGGGLQWIPAKRLAVFTNISAGLTDITPRLSVLAGFAVAF